MNDEPFIEEEEDDEPARDSDNSSGVDPPDPYISEVEDELESNANVDSTDDLGSSFYSSVESRNIPPAPDKEEIESKVRDISEIVDEVIAGKWGEGQERRIKLTRAGYSYLRVMAAVHRKVNAR